jgi:hypothetical protein
MKGSAVLLTLDKQFREAFSRKAIKVAGAWNSQRESLQAGSEIVGRIASQFLPPEHCGRHTAHLDDAPGEDQNAQW